MADGDDGRPDLGPRLVDNAARAKAIQHRFADRLQAKETETLLDLLAKLRD